MNGFAAKLLELAIGKTIAAVSGDEHEVTLTFNDWSSVVITRFGIRRLAPQQLRDAKVEQIGHAPVGHEDVVGLEVAVYDAGLDADAGELWAVMRGAA